MLHMYTSLKQWFAEKPMEMINGILFLLGMFGFLYLAIHISNLIS